MLVSAKEYYNSYLKRKNKKLVKRSKIITQQPKTLENQNLVDIQSIIIEHPKTSRKLSKAVRQTEKNSQASGTGENSDAYYIAKKRVKIFIMKKSNVKITE